MEKKERERKNQKTSFKEVTVLALLYYWTVGDRPDPIADLGLYGLNLTDTCDSLIPGLIENGWVNAFIHVPIPRRRYCDYEIEDTCHIISHPEKFREALVVTEEGMPKLKKYMADYNLIDLLVRRH